MFPRDRLGGPAVHAGDPAHDREPEARPGKRPRLRRPVEPVEDIRQVVRGDSRAIVADLDRPVGGRDADAALRRAHFSALSTRFPMARSSASGSPRTSVGRPSSSYRSPGERPGRARRPAPRAGQAGRLRYGTGPARRARARPGR